MLHKLCRTGKLLIQQSHSISGHFRKSITCNSETPKKVLANCRSIGAHAVTNMNSQRDTENSVRCDEVQGDVAVQGKDKYRCSVSHRFYYTSGGKQDLK